MSVQQIQQQQQVAKQAYESGQITKEDYAKFMTFSEGQKQKLIASTVKTNVGVSPTPEGYEVVGAKTYVPAPIPPEFGSSARAVYNPINPPATVTEFEYRKKAETVVIGSGGLLGVQTFLPKEEARRQGYNVDAAKYVAVYNPEEKAIRGLGAATIVATGVTVPAAGVASVLGTSGAEALKFGVTGEHLTVDEALAVAGSSQAAYFAAKMLAPFAKQTYEKLINRLSPERAMYNRVVVEQVGESAPAGTKSFGQRLTEKISPERAMYNRVVEGAKTPKVSTGPISTLADKLTGGTEVKPINTGKWVQQQVLLQKPKVKLEIKPFTAPQQTVSSKILTTSAALLTSPKTTSVTKKITATAAKTQQVQKAVTQQTAPTIPLQNPFTSYKGKPFYRQRQREESEIVAINYPANSPLQQPEVIVAPKVADLTQSQQGQKQAQNLRNKLVQVERQVPRVGQREAQLESQLQREDQSGQQAQRVAQVVQSSLRQESPNRPRYPGLPRLGGSGGGARGSSGFDIGKWYKKRNPVATISQNLQVVAGFGKKEAKAWGRVLGEKGRVKSRRRSSTKKKRKRRSRR